MIQYEVKIFPAWFPEGAYKQEIYVCANETDLIICINSFYSNTTYEIITAIEL